MKINMCNMEGKVHSAAYFEVWRRMLETATVTGKHPVKDRFFTYMFRLSLWQLS
jgi:hypothetical protein